MYIMSAGPTSISQKVRTAMLKDFTNTDLDQDYIKFQRGTEKKLSRLLHTEAKSFLMLGEAMLGLDGAVASFVEANDRVLVLSNGIFGAGFADFVKMYRGIPVVFASDMRHGLDLAGLKSFLEADHDFKAATLIHCETPTGIANDIRAICQLLHSYGILSIVDSVSGMGGEFIDFDEFNIDCLIGGTQKCISSLTGLTTITLSQRAIDCLSSRKSLVSAFYGNFQNYLKTDEFAFPYTQSETLVYALDAALDEMLEVDLVKRHQSYAQKTRYALTKVGLELYAQDHQANTVTTVLLPAAITADEILHKMQAEGFIISAGMGHLNGKAIRIGHMGNNIADEGIYRQMLQALNKVLLAAGVPLRADLLQEFINCPA